MVAQAVFEGVIPAEGVEDLLGGLEEIGTTGVLAFQSTSGSGSIRLVHGQVADASTTADEERALEVLLSLRDGEFAVYPKLPHLPISRGTDSTRRGSLAVHPPADLMRYCENAGLTGRLLLELRGRLAIGYYEKGELSDVSIDGGTAADFVLALEWTDGTFRVDAVPPPRETLPPALRDKTPQAPPKNPTALPLLEATRTRTPRSASFGGPTRTSEMGETSPGTPSTILPPCPENLIQVAPCSRRTTEGSLVSGPL
ncbi:MAG: DUF4388 domain-containing protein [Deltaproteobacteria bacterium]|nr:DUF4388 domain-containing protein [Deltaproteobacteria bacterium]